MGKKTYYIIVGTLVALLISFLFVYKLVYQKKQSFDKNIKEIEKVKDEVDEMILSGNKVGNNSKSKKNNSTGDLNKGISSNISNNKDIEDINVNINKNLDNISVEELKSFYGKSITEGNLQGEIYALKKLYKKTNETSLLYLLVDKLIADYSFKEALKYMRKIYKIDPQLEKIKIERFFYVMFNGLTLNKKQLKNLENLLVEFFNKGRLSKNQLTFYRSLIDLSKLNIDKFEKKVLSLSGKEYKAIRSDISSSKEKFKSYKDVPKYYYYGLLSFNMFQYKYFNIASKLSKETLKYNSEYILPYQVLGYSSFLNKNRIKSVNYYKQLLKIDSKNSNIYKFFLGISHYWNNNYEDAIVFLSQVDGGEYIKDAYRYLVLSYYQIGDYKNLLNYFEKLIKFDYLTESDYYTFFDIIFYKPWEEDKEFSLFESNSKLALNYLKKCYKQFNKDYIYICRYGKAGYHMYKGENDKTLKYLKYLKDYYPRVYIYETIGDIYYKKENYTKAKNNYVQAILKTNKINERDKLKDKIVEMMVGKEK